MNQELLQGSSRGEKVVGTETRHTPPPGTMLFLGSCHQGCRVEGEQWQPGRPGHSFLLSGEERDRRQACEISQGIQLCSVEGPRNLGVRGKVPVTLRGEGCPRLCRFLPSCQCSPVVRKRGPCTQARNTLPSSRRGRGPGKGSPERAPPARTENGPQELRRF